MKATDTNFEENSNPKKQSGISFEQIVVANKLVRSKRPKPFWKSVFTMRFHLTFIIFSQFRRRWKREFSLLSWINKWQCCNTIKEFLKDYTFDIDYNPFWVSCSPYEKTKNKISQIHEVLTHFGRMHNFHLLKQFEF